MSYFPKSKDAAEQVVESALNDRVILVIEDWHDEDLDYRKHLDMDAFEAEKERLAAFLAKRYEVTSRRGTMDSRVARALRSYASGINLYFDEAEITTPQFAFTHMEQMQDIKYLVQDTREEAESQDWATADMPADFDTIQSFLDYQQKLLHQWIYHLAVCENCFTGERSQPIFPPIDSEKLMDEAGGGASGDRQQGHEPAQQSSPTGTVDFHGGSGEDPISEEKYRRLIEPVCDSVSESIRVQADEINAESLHEADLEAVPEPICGLLSQGYSPVHEILDDMKSKALESFYIRLRLHPSSGSGGGDLACFVSSGHDLRPQGLSEVADQIGMGLAEHIADNVRPKLQRRSGLQTVIIEVETEDRLMHVVLESGSALG